MNGGQQFVFGKRLNEEYGEGTADRILQESNKTKKWSVPELEELCRHYKKRVDEIKAQRGME